jgi:hypothetical protein
MKIVRFFGADIARNIPLNFVMELYAVRYSKGTTYTKRRLGELASWFECSKEL